MNKISKLVKARLEEIKNKQKKIKSEFIISTHAYKRVCERLGCGKHKVEKIVEKAWRSKDRATFVHLEKFNRYDGFSYRAFNGYVFIFSTKECKKKILVTVIPHYKKGLLIGEDIIINNAKRYC